MKLRHTRNVHLKSACAEHTMDHINKESVEQSVQCGELRQQLEHGIQKLHFAGATT